MLRSRNSSSKKTEGLSTGDKRISIAPLPKLANRPV